MSDANPPQRITEAVEAPDDALRPQLKRLFRLQWEPAQDAHVLLYPEGMVKLNQSAAQILLRCDGTRDIPKLVADLEDAFGASNLGDDVRAFIAGARARGWLA
ncbi:pyrroloquinoline quinone biosynthesis peptide chaperone PqqD [Caballeronia sp. TF1N1]|uniref:pyrroloquinoline quinone biosynthesis peptide chaperone PqqD n=1 Tax=Caballeronia sp. TF1N1 TaxID=2878153 RepID=UPI001FD014D5|nr:pyrroloquinoline quinone biosynthesis peptide chaperone PqqD [Caballeronia sp. TF1N1]